MYFDSFLVCGISLPVAQLFVNAIENIHRRGVGNLTRFVSPDSMCTRAFLNAEVDGFYSM